MENYYRNYKDKFEKFARLSEPVVNMNNKYKFYSNPNTLFFKFTHTQPPHALAEWLQELKRTLKLTSMAADAPQEYAQQVRRYGENAN